MSDLHRILSHNTKQIWDWMQTRGGVAIWDSADLSDPSKSWTCPLKTEQGLPPTKPSWQSQGSPSRIITDPAEILVDVPKEVKRFRVAVRMSGNGLNLKLTDASTARVRKACEKAGENSWYEFDYYDQQAVILVPGSTKPLKEFIDEQAKSGSPEVSQPSVQAH